MPQGDATLVNAATRCHCPTRGAPDMCQCHRLSKYLADNNNHDLEVVGTCVIV